MNTIGHVITDKQLQEYEEYKKLVEGKKKFRIEFYDVMGSLSSIERMQSFYVPNPSKDYLEIDVLNTNEVSQAVINMLEEWFGKYEDKHKIILKEINDKIKYLHENDKDMRIPRKTVPCTGDAKFTDIHPNGVFKHSFLDYLKGLVKLKW